jgi:hypothetical protein
MNTALWSRSAFVERAARRGYTLDEVRACIVSDDGTTIAIDVDHPAYPREAKPGFSPPSLARKAVNFTKACAKHVANRGRQCTDEEIATRYAKCMACPGGYMRCCRCNHPSCGCKISPKRKFVNKLSWASESCPIGEWGAIT